MTAGSLRVKAQEASAQLAARRAKLAELGERVLEILQAEQRPAMVSREDFREWRPTAALVSAEIHTAARSLGLLSPAQQPRKEAR